MRNRWASQTKFPTMLCCGRAYILWSEMNYATKITISYIGSVSHLVRLVYLWQKNNKSSERVAHNRRFRGNFNSFYRISKICLKFLKTHKQVQLVLKQICSIFLNWLSKSSVVWDPLRGQSNLVSKVLDSIFVAFPTGNLQKSHKL